MCIGNLWNFALISACHQEQIILLWEIIKSNGKWLFPIKCCDSTARFLQAWILFHRMKGTTLNQTKSTKIFNCNCYVYTQLFIYL